MVHRGLGRAWKIGGAWSAAILAISCGGASDRGSPSTGVATGASPPSSPAAPPSGGEAPSADDAGAPGLGAGGEDASTSASANDAGAPLGDPDGGCTATFPPVTDFGAAGPFAVTEDNATTIPSLGTAACTIYRPTTLGQGGVQHPIVIWVNGTGTPTEIVYEWLFKQWASHGFIVAARDNSWRPERVPVVCLARSDRLSWIKRRHSRQALVP